MPSTPDSPNPDPIGLPTHKAGSKADLGNPDAIYCTIIGGVADIHTRKQLADKIVMGHTLMQSPDKSITTVAYRLAPSDPTIF